jgi:hypothetical protein
MQNFPAGSGLRTAFSRHLIERGDRSADCSLYTAFVLKVSGCEANTAARFHESRKYKSFE